MKELLKAIKKPSRAIYMIGAALYALLFAIVAIGNGATQGQFMPVFSGIIIMALGVVAIGGVPILMLVKKEEAAKIIFVILAGYWLVTQTQTLIGMGSNIVDGADATLVAGSVFAFISGLVLLVIAILVVIYTIFNKKSKLMGAAFWIMAAFVILSLITGVILLVAYGKASAQWPVMIEAVSDFFVAPTVVVFGYIYFFSKVENEPAKVEQKEEPKEEPAQE